MCAGGVLQPVLLNARATGGRMGGTSAGRAKAVLRRLVASRLKASLAGGAREQGPAATVAESKGGSSSQLGPSAWSEVLPEVAACCQAEAALQLHLLFGGAGAGWLSSFGCLVVQQVDDYGIVQEHGV